MPEWVRIEDPSTGHKSSVTAAQADLMGIKPLKEEAVSVFGMPLPPTYQTTVDEAAAAKTKGA